MANPCGFTDAEQRCHDALMDCYRLYLELPRQHPNEIQEFGYAVHLIQGLLGMRILRRDHSEGWPTHEVG